MSGELVPVLGVDVVRMASRGASVSQLSDDQLQDAIRQLDAAKTPCTANKAAELAMILIGSYARVDVPEPAIYARSISSVLQRYPAWAASRAVDAVTLKIKYPPSRAHVFEACEVEMGAVAAAYSNAVALQLKRAADKREADEAANVARLRNEFLERHGGKSPLEVLAQRGITVGQNDEKEVSNGKENDGNESADPGKRAGQSG